jgi:hypothetical protein
MPAGLRNAADTLTKTTTTHCLADTVTGASEDASANARTLSAGTKQMSASVADISRHV